MKYLDYYKILGVDKSATEAEIKRAYRKLARKHHPDVNPGDKKAEEHFKEINEAYEVLSDSERRRKYDQLGSSYGEWQSRGGAPGGFDWSQWTTPGGVRVEYGDLGDLFGQAGFSDFFNTVFGGEAAGQQARRRSVRTPGRDLEQEIEITLEEAFHGAQRVLEKEGRRLEVKIPAGVSTGAKVRIAGEGGLGLGGAASGNLYLVVKVLPHPVFEVDGTNLRCEASLPLYTAVLGGELCVPTLSGECKLKIPPETQSGQTFRLRNQGMPHLRTPDKRGDLLVKVRVMTPQQLTASERELFVKLSQMRKG